MDAGTLYFCTLFDSHYLSRGLAMYDSLVACCPDFQLYIFAFDDKAEEILGRLSLPGVTVVPLKEFEDEELLRIKPTRSRAEYCWTCASSTILHCLERFNLSHCTYLDADLYFYNDPSILLDEMEDNSILITEHRYSPQYEKAVLAGKYCVQFITFRNDEYGLSALRWWRDRCIEWCYARHEDGKFGDQKYLDDWTVRFPKVHVLRHLGGGLAAWNIQQYHVVKQDGRLFCTEKATGKFFEPVFYHFHYLRFYSDGTIELGRRQLDDEVVELFYKPYVPQLEKSKAYIMAIDDDFDPHGASSPPRGLKHSLITAYRKFKSVYHIYPKRYFITE